MSEVRKAIIATYAEWTAMSALRSGAPIKSRREVYTAVRGVDFAVLFDNALGPIHRTTFDAWHAHAIQEMIKHEPRLTVGWATKIINVYLKTRVYIGAQGRHHLKEMIHPPHRCWLVARTQTAIRRSTRYLGAYKLCESDQGHR